MKMVTTITARADSVDQMRDDSLRPVHILTNKGTGVKRLASWRQDRAT